MDDVSDAPDNCEGKRGDYNKRHQNGEDERNRPRHSGLERLLERPDKRHAEKRKRYGFQHDGQGKERQTQEPRQRGREQSRRSYRRSRSILPCPICCALRLDAAIRQANQVRCAAPGVVRQRLEASNRIGASDRLARGQ